MISALRKHRIARVRAAGKQLLLSVAVLFSLEAVTRAQTISVDPSFKTKLSSRGVSGGLSYLPNGDMLGWTDEPVGPSLYVYDANDDQAIPLDSSLITRFQSGTNGDFVKVSPNGTFAIFSVSGVTRPLYRVSLTSPKPTQTNLLTESGSNYDLAFLNDLSFLLSRGTNGNSALGTSEVRYLTVANPQLAQTIISVPQALPGAIALNGNGDLYYAKRSSQTGSAELLRFSSAKISNAISQQLVLSETDSDLHVPLDGASYLTYHGPLSAQGEIYITTGGNKVLLFRESDESVKTFLTVTSPSSARLSALQFFEPQGSFDGTAQSRTELGLSLSTSSSHLLQVRVDTSGVDVQGFCKSPNTDCIHQSLRSSACVGANGFLSQVNIASVINLQPADLTVQVEYFDLTGTRQGRTSAKIGPNTKQDFIINDMGLARDTVGTVCVDSDGADGSWTGGIAIYKPDFRAGGAGFGTAFDFALYYPFLNPFETPVTVPLNTFHLGTDPKATVANWIAISDADRDGAPLTGTLLYFNAAGANTGSEAVDIPDGGRRDYAGHVGVGGIANNDAYGMAQFVPDPKPNGQPSKYYMTLTRYFYDCPGAGSGCPNFLTAFNLPYRPATRATIHGGTSSVNGEISIVELTNVSTAPTSAAVQVFSGTGQNPGNQFVDVPPRGTHHVILQSEANLASNSASTSTVSTSSGFISAVSLFYKLNQFGQLVYAYAAPFTSSPGLAQLSQYNSFIFHENVPEIFNSGDKDLTVNADFISSTGKVVAQKTIFALKPNETQRLSFSPPIPADDYGTIILQSDHEGLIGRNYVRREGMYVLPFGAD
ncbi:MAG: hypothetical protein U0136_21085 [Bdellovibrionota bacterium]